MNSASMKSLRSGPGASPVRAPSKDLSDSGSSAARYGRVAMVEAALSIRDRQQRVTRRLVVASLVLTGIAVIVAGLSGWF